MAPRFATAAAFIALYHRSDLTTHQTARRIATGIGTLVLGILTVLGEASEGIHEFLEFVERVGPLSGKTILASAAFFISWGGLHMALRDREIDLRPVLTATVALVAIALVLTFPPFFQLFKSE